MSLEEKSRISKVREFEKFIDLVSQKRKLSEGIIAWVPFSEVEQEPPKPKNHDEIMRLGAEVQELKNQMNRFMRTESRDESINQFKQMISSIKEIKQVYVNHKIDKVNFLISYDSGFRTDITEKVVDIEIEIEKIFRDLKFDFHLFPSDSCTQTFSSGELIYSRGE
jgi:hypothetical protein